MESYLVAELIPLLAQALPIKARRLGVFGHSMGGHGALTLSLRHPGLFKSVSAFAPVCAPKQCPWGQKAFAGYLGPDTALWSAHDASALMSTCTEVPYAEGILIDQGPVSYTHLDVYKRQVKTIAFEPTQEEQDCFERLTRILAASAEQAGRKGAGDIVGLILKKRFLSSPWALGRTLEAYRLARAGAAFDEDEFFDLYDETLGLGASDEEEGEQDQPEFEALQSAKNLDPLASASHAELDDLIEWGLGHESKPDSRLTALTTFLDAVCRPDGTWGNERVVVFTEYAATLEWVRRCLEQRGYDRDRLGVIQGSTKAEDRELVRARFTADPTTQKVRVLLATDSAGEGIDLQTHCHRLVNYDIPFNPSRLEQRIGRIDRYGQPCAPEIFHFAPATGTSTYAEDTVSYTHLDVYKRQT